MDDFLYYCHRGVDRPLITEVPTEDSLDDFDPEEG